MAHRMESFPGKEVITGETCHEGILYIPVLHQSVSVSSFDLISFQSHRNLVLPTRDACTIDSFIFNLGPCRTDTRSFSSAGVRGFACPGLLFAC